jgi:hypothetical protein
VHAAQSPCLKHFTFGHGQSTSCFVLISPGIARFSMVEQLSFECDDEKEDEEGVEEKEGEK